MKITRLTPREIVLDGSPSTAVTPATPSGGTPEASRPDRDSDDHPRRGFGPDSAP